MTLHEKFKNMVKKSSIKFYQKPQKMKEFQDYNENMNTLFDIFCEDQQRRTSLEKLFHIKMTPMVWSFLEGIRTTRKQYCESAVGCRWRKTMERKIRQENKLEEQRQKQIQAPNMILNESMQTEGETNHEIQMMKMLPLSKVLQEEQNDRLLMPPHPPAMILIRLSINLSEKVFMSSSQNFIKAVDVLISKYHCSKMQSMAAVIETRRIMFGRNNWKFHSENQNLIDLDTAPDKKIIRRAEGALQALSLSCLVEEIMESDDSVITYHTDSSKVQGTGGYLVQEITIDGKYRSLPALPISNECRDNLSLLKQTILSILSAASGVAVSDLFSKIIYQMIDATSHNLDVVKLVVMDLTADHITQHQFCQTHPCLMFNRKIVEVVRDIEKAILVVTAAIIDSSLVSHVSIVTTRAP